MKGEKIKKCRCGGKGIIESFLTPRRLEFYVDCSNKCGRTGFKFGTEAEAVRHWNI
jgi:hypothetical protein